MKNLSSKLGKSCYPVQSITVIISLNILRSVYFQTLTFTTSGTAFFMGWSNGGSKTIFKI